MKSNYFCLFLVLGLLLVPLAMAEDQQPADPQGKLEVKPVPNQKFLIYGHENNTVFKVEPKKDGNDGKDKLIAPYAFETTFSGKDADFYSLFTAVEITNYGYNDPPYPPSNPNPPDGATNIPTDVTLSWTGGDPNPGDTVIYDVYLDKTSPPQRQVANDIYDTSYKPTTPLDPGTTYFWRVVAEDNSGEVTQGPQWRFTTSGIGPPTSTPTATPGFPSPTPTVTPTPAPPPHVPVMEPEPPYTAGKSNTVSWAESLYGVGYFAQCSELPNFADVYADSGWISGLSYTFDNLKDATKYYYRVKARNNANVESAWSNAVFSTQDASPPFIRLAGYLETNLTTSSGGQLSFAAYAVDNIGVDHVEIFYQGQGTGAYLPEVAEDVYLLTATVGPGLPPQRLLVELVAVDVAGNESFMWPYLTITKEAIVAAKSEKSLMFLAGLEPDDLRISDKGRELVFDWQRLFNSALNPADKSAKGAVPLILCGGYWDTALSEEKGGNLMMLVACRDYDGDRDIATVEVYYAGNRTGLYLVDDGTHGDWRAGDMLFSFGAPVGPLPEGSADIYLLQVVATDRSGLTSDMYPFLTID